MRATLFLATLAAAALLAAGCSSSSPPPSAREPAPALSGREPDEPPPGSGGASLFRLPLTDGRPVTVKTPAALYFFTTWCGYCRQKHPQIQAAAEKAREKGWRVYGINVGERPDQVANYIQQYQPRYPVLLDQNSQVANRYNVPGYPTFILIDRNANIVYNGHAVPDRF